MSARSWLLFLSRPFGTPSPSAASYKGGDGSRHSESFGRDELLLLANTPISRVLRRWASVEARCHEGFIVCEYITAREPHSLAR